MAWPLRNMAAFHLSLELPSIEGEVTSREVVEVILNTQLDAFVMMSLYGIGAFSDNIKDSNTEVLVCVCLESGL
ncbi:hypothetical protein BC829DRAFT_17317 [Chytridium lagenaria]|nr:hypothetical protein BC829DRAFT_17317 [Chytridium lagenaria]